MDHPLPWLRYLDADNVEDETIDFDRMEVESPTGEHLGNVDGFIVDSESGRAYYVVVDSGGWFKSKHFLLPVGYARFDAASEALIADLGRERIDKFPGFDKDQFDKLSVDELRRLNEETCQACSIEGVAIVYAADEPFSAAWDRPDYRAPDWWHAGPPLSRRLGVSAAETGTKPLAPSALAERVAPTATPGRERVAARESDPSPHFGGRAQPGDVIGVETGGEQTHVGETAEDENEHRREAAATEAKHRAHGATTEDSQIRGV